jgi:hypothetical protein
VCTASKIEPDIQTLLLFPVSQHVRSVVEDSRGPQHQRFLPAREAAFTSVAALAERRHVPRGISAFLRPQSFCNFIRVVAQVPVSSLNSAAADLETYVMRQSPRISDQLVTLNSRTFNVADSTLTPAMVSYYDLWLHSRRPDLPSRALPPSRLSSFCSRRTCTAVTAAAPSSLCCGSTGLKLLGCVCMCGE